MEAYIINLDEYESIGTYWIGFHVNGDNITYFDSFGVQYIKKNMKKIIGSKNIITNIQKIQPYNAILCGYFSIGFIDFMLKNKTLLRV